jgi:hypothetical protein
MQDEVLSHGIVWVLYCSPVIFLHWYEDIFVLSFLSFYHFSRVEAETLRHLSAKYCPLVPPPRSTIAAAFSPDGRALASTQ